MFDLAKTIQSERRRQAHHYRQVASVPTHRSLSIGRYKLTVDRQAN